MESPQLIKRFIIIEFLVYIWYFFGTFVKMRMTFQFLAEIVLPGFASLHKAQISL